MSEIYPYEAVRKIAPRLYVVDGDWKKTKFRRRMTIVELNSGELVLHSPIRMADKDVRALESLGKVRYIVAPNIFHNSDVPWYAERYPTAKVFVPEKSVAKLNSVSRVTGTLERDWPTLIEPELSCYSIRGAWMAESVFYHKVSKTLICTDLVFNMGNVFRGVEKIFMKWNQVVNRFGPSRTLRWIFVHNRAQFSESIRELVQLDFDRVIMGHGDILESNGRPRFEEAFSRYLRV